jgi:uncharacterized protein (TIGR02246 family)
VQSFPTHRSHFDPGVTGLINSFAAAIVIVVCSLNCATIAASQRKELPMKRTHTASLTMVLTFLSFGALISLAPHRVKADDDESPAIMKVIDGFTDSFNHHDAHAVAMWFTQDADFINVGQMTSHGPKDIEAHFVPLFTGRLKNSHRTYTLRTIRFLSPTVASVTMNYELTNTLDASGNAVPPRKGLYDWIVTKQNGTWLINILHESEGEPPQANPARP